MSNIQLTVEQINQLDPLAIVTNPLVRDKFISIYEAMWTPVTGVSGEAAYECESRNFNRLLGEKEDLRKTCTRFSLFTAFLDVAISGLSLDPGARAQAYLLSRSITVGTYMDGAQKKNQYETHAQLTISGYGELIYRARCGQIRHADNPVIVYEEDEFAYGETKGQKFVDYTCRLPHTSGRIKAAFIKITRPDYSVDYAVMLPEDWTRLAGYSARQNAKYDYQAKQWRNWSPNALYGSRNEDGTMAIDAGFLVAKLIKHAFKTYPKARVGRGTVLESQKVDEPEINDDLYGIDTTTGEVKDTGFAPAQDISTGVTVDPAAKTGDDDDVF